MTTMRKMTTSLIIVLAVATAPAIVDAAMNTAAGVGGDPLSGGGRQSLLYDQTDAAAGNGAPDQDFEAAYDVYDAEGADDFEVTWTDGWNVQQIQTVGTQSAGGSANTASITIYSDAAGFPGSQLCSYSGLAVTDTAGALTINLPSDCFVGLGVAWVAVQAQQDFATDGQHFWSNRLTQTLSESVWRNPGGGFGIPACQAWGRQQSVCGVGGAAGPDFLFQVWGEQAVGPTPTPQPPSGALNPVPTLSSYGIVAMVLMIVGIAVLLMWRRN